MGKVGAGADFREGKGVGTVQIKGVIIIILTIYLYN